MIAHPSVQGLPQDPPRPEAPSLPADPLVAPQQHEDDMLPLTMQSSQSHIALGLLMYG